jgi:4-amino-4-deoxy-L-arabinose transferase-like glycosyltransferase
MNLKRIFIIVFVAALTISAFVMRLETFKKTKWHSIDEIVYFRLGLQLKENPTNYNTLAVRDWLTDDKRELPAYFDQPLFKHPPLFFYFLVASYHLFGEDPVSAVSVSIFFGVLMIPLIYLLGKLLFGDIVGLASACLLFIDPISIISSQKVWMDSTLAFLMVLAVYFFVRGLKLEKDQFFIFSGIASGLAVLVKYPGVLAELGILVYVLMNQRSLIKNPKFILGLLLPLVMLLPWVYWNYMVYHWGFVSEFLRSHSLGTHYSRIVNFIYLLIFLFLASWLWKKQPAKLSFLDRSRTLLKTFLFVLFAWYFHEKILLGWRIDILPPASRYQGLFAHSHHSFYIGKLMEFSFLYFFAFLSYFLFWGWKENYLPLLQWVPAVVLAFYSFWGGYQSRYMTAVIPFLIILAVVAMLEIQARVSDHPNRWVRWSGQAFLVASLIIILGRCSFINSLLTATNNAVYF